MQPLPSGNLRSNRGTWAVPTTHLPAVAALMIDLAPVEVYDPSFRGQKLETTYFDTQHFALRAARKQGDRYLTLRLRCYEATGKAEVYALSAKTESEKFRLEIPSEAADLILSGQMPEWPGAFLPANLLARLDELRDDDLIQPVVCVCCQRYAVEDDLDRWTLDVGVHTDLGKCLPFAVLEYKSTESWEAPSILDLRPVKISKFLWATKP